MNNKELKKKLIKKFGKWFYDFYFMAEVEYHYYEGLECVRDESYKAQYAKFSHIKHGDALWNRIYGELAKYHLEYVEVREVTSITITKLEENND